MIKTRLFGYKLFLVVTLKVFISIDIHGMLKLRTFPSKEVVKEVINVRDRQISDSLNAYVLECAQNNFIPAQLLLIQENKDSFFDKQEQQKYLDRGVLAYKKEAELKKYDELIEFGLSCEYGDGIEKNIVAACESY